MWNDFSDNEQMLDKVCNLNSRGQKYEKAGKISQAIKCYETVASYKFNGTMAYERLAIIYKKQNKPEEELRIRKQLCDILVNEIEYRKNHPDIWNENIPKELTKHSKRVKKLEELFANKAV